MLRLDVGTHSMPFLATGPSMHCLSVQAHVRCSLRSQCEGWGGAKVAHHCPFANAEVSLLYAPAHRLLDGCIHLCPDALCPLNGSAAMMQPSFKRHETYVYGLQSVQHLLVAKAISRALLIRQSCKHRGHHDARGCNVTCSLMWLHWLSCALHGQHGQTCTWSSNAAPACAPPALLMISSFSNA